jgi:hypothetical protein
MHGLPHIKLSGREARPERDLHRPVLAHLSHSVRESRPADFQSSSGQTKSDSLMAPLPQQGVERQPAAIALVALTGSFRTLQSALRFASFGRLRSVSHE